MEVYLQREAPDGTWAIVGDAVDWQVVPNARSTAPLADPLAAAMVGELIDIMSDHVGGKDKATAIVIDALDSHPVPLVELFEAMTSLWFAFIGRYVDGFRFVTTGRSEIAAHPDPSLINDGDGGFTFRNIPVLLE